MIVTPVPSTALTNFEVLVATPESRCTKLIAVRSAVSNDWAFPETSRIWTPGKTLDPSCSITVTSHAGSTLRNTSAPISTPATTPSDLATRKARPLRCSETKYWEVTSPDPMSSLRASSINCDTFSSTPEPSGLLTARATSKV